MNFVSQLKLKSAFEFDLSNKPENDAVINILVQELASSSQTFKISKWFASFFKT